MPTTSESKEWRRFLQPLVTGLVALMAAAALALQNSDATTFDSRISVVETKVEGIGELRKDVNDLSKNVHELIGEIRAERSFK